MAVRSASKRCTDAPMYLIPRMQINEYLLGWFIVTIDNEKI